MIEMPEENDESNGGSRAGYGSSNEDPDEVRVDESWVDDLDDGGRESKAEEIQGQDEGFHSSRCHDCK